MGVRSWRGLLTWLRRMGFGRNPLRRRSDRIESFTLVVVLFGALAVIPMAVFVGRDSYDHGTQVSADRSARYHATVAVLQENAQAVVKPSVDSGSSGQSSANATWLSPNGSPQSGVVEVGFGARTGESVFLLTDDNGDPVAAAKTTTELGAEAITVGLMFAIGWLAVLASAYALCRQLLNRRRMTEWDAQWEGVGKTWSRYTL
jgi:hypothetical protein